MTKKSQRVDAAWRIYEDTGKPPTIKEVMAAVGGGSARDIHAAIKSWESELAGLVHHARHHPALPDAVYQGLKCVWDEAVARAKEITEQDYQKKQSALAARESDIAEKIKAVTTERNAAQQELDALGTTHQQTSARLDECRDELGRITREHNELNKDLALARQLADECETESSRLREQLDTLRQEHREALDTQRQHHEREEDRWAKLVDQARQDIKTALDDGKLLAAKLASVTDDAKDAAQEHALALASAHQETSTWKSRYEAEVKHKQSEINRLTVRLTKAERDLAACTEQRHTATAQTKAMQELLARQEQRVADEQGLRLQAENQLAVYRSKANHEQKNNE